MEWKKNGRIWYIKFKVPRTRLKYNECKAIYLIAGQGI